MNASRERTVAVRLSRLLVPVLFAAGVALQDAASAAPSGDAERAIARQLHRYEQALNASDADAIMSLYDDAPVVMVPNAPTIVGREALRNSITHALSAMKLNVRFSIDEIKPMSPDWAFARTHSTGRVDTLTGKHATQPEANQELFILHRGPDGVWRIARYGFSSTNLPAA